MSEYTLEIKQIVDYPRCRIYRQFVQALIADRSIRVSGGSGLFYFVVLCAYANFRTSYKRIDGISYIRDISYRTYFRKRQMAIDALSSVLWGYSSKESLALLEKFVPEADTR